MSRHHHPLIAYLIRRTTSRRFLVGNLLFLALVCAIFTSSTGKNHPVSKRAKASLEKGGRYLKSLAYEDDFSTGNGTTGFGSKWSEGSAGYCSEAAYLDGRWIQREKPFETEEEVRQAWGLTVSTQRPENWLAYRGGKLTLELGLFSFAISLSQLCARRHLLRTWPNSNAKRSTTRFTEFQETLSMPSESRTWLRTNGDRRAGVARDHSQERPSLRGC